MLIIVQYTYYRHQHNTKILVLMLNNNYTDIGTVYINYI